MIHIKRSKNKQFYFTVMAKNGRVLCTSETYKRKHGCLTGINSLVKKLKANITIIDKSKKK